MWLLTFLFPFVCSCQSISPHCGNLPAWYCNLLFPNKLFSPTYVLLPVSMTPAKILRLLLFFLKCLHADSCSGISLYDWSLLRLWKCSPLPEFLRNTGLQLPLKERNEEERRLTDPWVITVCSLWGFLSPSLPGYNTSQVGHFLITVILCLLGLVVYSVTQPWVKSSWQGAGGGGTLSRTWCLVIAKLCVMKNANNPAAEVNTFQQYIIFCYVWFLAMRFFNQKNIKKNIFLSILLQCSSSGESIVL